MQGTISSSDLNQRVTELDNGVLDTTQTERKEAWEQLLREPLMDKTPAGFAIFNEDFVLTKCNRTYADFIGRHTPYTVEKLWECVTSTTSPGARNSPARGLGMSGTQVGEKPAMTSS